MGLDPQAQVVLDTWTKQHLPPWSEMDVPQVRDAVMSLRAIQGEPEAVARVTNRTVPGPAGELPIRIYSPATTERPPVLVYFHAGGWVSGSISRADTPVRALANATRCIIVSVEYRLSPESKFPAPAEDCYAATQWVAEHANELGGDPERIGVIGDSAGGNLAAAVTLMARDRGTPRLALQALICPAMDTSTDTDSYRQCADGYLLTLEGMEWFWGHYLATDADRSNPYACPLAAQDYSRLPPAIVFTCEYDPLRDEGETYGQRLAAAGVAVQILRYDGMLHGVFGMGGVMDRTRTMLTDIALAVDRHLRASRSGTD
jgi:acetyl esterase